MRVYSLPQQRFYRDVAQQRQVDSHIDWREEYMKYGVEVGWGAMIYLSSFIKSASGIQTLMGGGVKDTDHKSLLQERTLQMLYQK
jgi:hypothetical protein